MEITPDQKRAICTILVEQAGRRVRNTELTALCDDDTINAALHFLIRLIEIKHAEITAGQAAALAELQSQNPQMVMGSLLSGSSLSVQNGETTEAEPAEPEAAVSNTPVEENTEEATETQDPLKNHSWLFEDTDTDDTDLPPLGMFSEPTEKQNDITEQPQAALKETVAEPAEDTVTEFAGKPAQPATVVLSDILSFSGTPDVPQREPVNTPVITETAQRELPADTVTIPVKDHTEETADDTAAKVADHIASIFGDKSLFPEFAEPAGTQDPLKNHSWLFEDTDTDDTGLPPLGMFSEPTEKQDNITEQPQAALKETVAEPVEDTVTEPAGKPAQPATAVLSDIFSFSGTPDVPQSEPVNTPVIAEAAQSEFPADTVTIPVKDHTEETAEDTAAKVADHIASIFGDKSLFPEFAEPAETQDPLKNHSWLFEDTDTNDTDLPPLGMFSEPTEKQNDITEQPQAALKETVAEPVEDTVTEPAGKPAQPATAVLSDIFSFSGTPDVPQSEPVNTPVMAEAAQSESPSEQEITPCNASAVAVTLPAEGNTENQAASDAADHMTSVFSDKSLFPELSDLTGKPGQLKNHSWLFDDLDTDDSDTPAIGDLPAEPVQHVPTGTTQFNSLPPATKQQDNDLLAENWLFADDTDAADPKPWGLAALLAAGKTSGKNRDKPATTPTGPVFKDVTKDSKPVTEPEKEQGSEYISLPPAGPADIMTAHSDTQADPLMPPAPTRPTIRIEVARARQNEPFNSPVTATLHDGRHVSVLGIYFQSSIGLNFNERTSTLYGKPTESGEFSLRVVWELTPKRRFSTDVTFFVSPDPHSPPPLPEIYASPAE